MKLHKEHFEHWIFQQPKDEIVDLFDGTACLLCRFFRDQGRTIKASFDMFVFIDRDNNPYGVTDIFHYHHIPEWFREVVHPGLNNRFQTMGQLQDRFRSVFPLDEEEKTDTETKAEECPVPITPDMCRNPYRVIQRGELEELMETNCEIFVWSST